MMGSEERDKVVEKKIQELEEGHAYMKQQMSNLKLSDARENHQHHHHRQRSHSVSPQRSRLGSWNKNSCSFKHSSPLQRETRAHSQSLINFTEKQYLNILQSIGHSVHILDLNSRIIYWLVFYLLLFSIFAFFFFFFFSFGSKWSW